VSPENLLDLLVLYRGAADVNTVIIDGRIVMREREVLTLDEEQVKAEARRSARRVWEKAAA
jgi:5-methylthioadenosine/S-adenosylhomocysteine deaminase